MLIPIIGIMHLFALVMDQLTWYMQGGSPMMHARYMQVPWWILFASDTALREIFK